MSPRDRENVDGLEPELRTMRSEEIGRRRLSPALTLLLAGMRAYVVVAVALVIVTFVRVLHH